MARYPEGYHQILARLNERFSYDMLTMNDVMAVTGYKHKDTVRKYFGDKFVGNRINKEYVARGMCPEKTK